MGLTRIRYFCASTRLMITGSCGLLVYRVNQQWRLHRYTPTYPSRSCRTADVLYTGASGHLDTRWPRSLTSTAAASAACMLIVETATMRWWPGLWDVIQGPTRVRCIGVARDTRVVLDYKVKSRIKPSTRTRPWATGGHLPLGSHSVTCHPTQVNSPRLNPSR